MLPQKQTQRKSRPRILLPSEFGMASCARRGQAKKEKQGSDSDSSDDSSYSYYSSSAPAASVKPQRDRTSHCFLEATTEQGSQGDDQQQQQFMKLGTVLMSSPFFARVGGLDGFSVIGS